MSCRATSQKKQFAGDPNQHWTKMTSFVFAVLFQFHNWRTQKPVGLIVQLSGEAGYGDTSPFASPRLRKKTIHLRRNLQRRGFPCAMQKEFFTTFTTRHCPYMCGGEVDHSIKAVLKTGCAQEVWHTSRIERPSWTYPILRRRESQPRKVAWWQNSGNSSVRKGGSACSWASVRCALRARLGLNARMKRRHRTETPPPSLRKVGSVCGRPGEQGGIKRTPSPINWRRGRQRRCGGAQAHQREREAERCWGFKGRRLTGPLRASLIGNHRRPRRVRGDDVDAA